MIRWLALFWMAACVALTGSAFGATANFPLVNGEELTGEPMGPDPRGVIIKKTDGTYSERIGWTNFSQTALKNLSTGLPKTAMKWIEPLLEEDEPVVTKPRAAAPALKFNPPARLDRPDKKAGIGNLFDSPLMVVLFLLLYAANIYAGYEIAAFRNYHPGIVCGVAAAAPLLGPAIFAFLPTNVKTETEEVPLHQPSEHVYEPLAMHADGQAEAAPAPAEAEAHPKSGFPPPVIYQRGTTTFNRRFFETKLTAFMKVVPGEAEKDLVICVKSARGDYIGQRISKIQPNEFYLQVKKGEASSDVIVPYGELFELKIRHKDAA